ncbi:cutinase-domain-containing protein [Pterulicium gracile]|uniref:Cutinase n=1 Tax=Pterulicium gracile TaxID=1884261 RepID=A0A5C3Q7Y9_9AGAR|nr:cutinase-domain-containing protein [Pterula gracilis]
MLQSSSWTMRKGYFRCVANLVIDRKSPQSFSQAPNTIIQFALVLALFSLLPFVASLPAPAGAAVPSSPKVVDALIQQSAVAEASLIGDTENELSGPCKALTLIYARGTTEPGNVGGSTGQALFTALRSRLGSSAIDVQGVNYPADVAGYLVGGDPAGSTTMFNLINQAASKCPNTKIVIGGYSQGAQLTHNASERLSAATTARIAAVFAYGDPNYPRAFGSIPRSSTLNICHIGDIICTGLGTMAAHLTYGIRDTDEVTAFIAARA